MIKIDKAVPLPPVNTGKNVKYPLRYMEVGDSFFVEGVTVSKLSGTLPPHKPKKFSTRSVTEGGVDGVRVWRVL